MVVVIETPEVDRRAVETFENELERALAGYQLRRTDDRDPLVLDLRNVTFMDSTGLRCLIDTDRAVAACGGRLEVLAQGIPRRLLEVTGLLDRFEPVPDVIDLRAG
jgi:anti-anti-sigma factor